MRGFIAALCLLAAAAPATAASDMAAASHMAASRMTCAQVQEHIASAGSVVMTYRSSSNPCHAALQQVRRRSRFLLAG
jgi:hypothetical protein